MQELTEKGCPICDEEVAQADLLAEGDLSGPDGRPWGMHLGWNREEEKRTKQQDNMHQAAEQEEQMWQRSLQKADGKAVQQRRRAQARQAERRKEVENVHDVGRGVDRVPIKVRESLTDGMLAVLPEVRHWCAGRSAAFLESVGGQAGLDGKGIGELSKHDDARASRHAYADGQPGQGASLGHRHHHQGHPRRWDSFGEIPVVEISDEEALDAFLGTHSEM